MNSRFVVDKQQGLKEVQNAGLHPNPVWIRIAAKVLSTIFHPVFVPVWLVIFLLYIQPYVFAGFSAWDKTKVFLQAFVLYSFFPIVTVLLLKALDFISTIFLYTQKDRIIPLAASGIWYFWIWWVWHNQPQMPETIELLALAILFAVSFAWFANIFMKISLHAISMGVMIAYVLTLAFSQPLHSGIYISIVLLVSGLVCTSRFIISDHRPQDIYGGLAIGAISLVLAQWLS